MILKFQVSITKPYSGRITKEDVSQKLGSIIVLCSNCVTFRLKEKKILEILLAVTNNQYAFSVVIGACTLK
jgi:hypothetical protein